MQTYLLSNPAKPFLIFSLLESLFASPVEIKSPCFVSHPNVKNKQPISPVKHDNP